MNKDTIIDMAREARLWKVLDLFSGEFGNANTEEDCLPDLTRFAALVAAHEREACARICDTWPTSTEYTHEIAAAIRSRT